MGHVGVGWWGGSCRGEEGWFHVGVGCDWVGHVGVGWGWVSYVGVGYSLNNLICHKLGVVFSSEKLLSTAFWIMWVKGFFFFFFFFC